MLALTVKYKRPVGRRYRRAKIHRYLYNRLRRLWRDSVTAFVEAAIDHMQSNIETGMSIASLSELAKRVRAKKLVIQTLSGEGSPRFRHPSEDEIDFYSSLGLPVPYPRSKAAGVRSSKGGSQINYGTKNRVVFSFHFDIRVYHFAMREEHGIWRVGEIGKQALNDFFTRNWANYIKVNNLVQFMFEDPPLEGDFENA